MGDHFGVGLQVAVVAASEHRSGAIGDPAPRDRPLSPHLQQLSLNRTITFVVGLWHQSARRRLVEDPANRYWLVLRDNVVQSLAQLLDLRLRPPSSFYGARTINTHGASLRASPGCTISTKWF